jgi:hypothetical protein
MVLGFNPRFVPKILDGTKIHTIRQDPHNRWVPGRTMHQATGVRTKNYHCFAEKVCTGVQSIEIIHGDIINPMWESYIMVDSALLYIDDMVELAINDGFDS